MNLEERAKSMKQEIFGQMLKTRPGKYERFLRLLKSFKHIPFNSKRGNFLESYYALMRYIDDVVDGDLPRPPIYWFKEDFVRARIDFSTNPSNPRENIDYLMLYCLNLRKEFGEDFSRETTDILYTMLFDAKRFGKNLVFPQKELDHHFYQLDIRGTGIATLKLFREDPGKFPYVEPLALANRIYTVLRDFEEDVRAGYMNIGAEDVKKYNIDSQMLSKENEGVSEWFTDQAISGLNLLEQHRQNMVSADFRLPTVLACRFVYEKPSREYFERVVKKS
jgi:hypothetical protein